MADYLSVAYDEGSHPYTDYPFSLCTYLFQAFQMKSGMKMLEPGCGRQKRNGLGETTLPGQQSSQIALRLGGARIERHGPPELLQRRTH